MRFIVTPAGGLISLWDIDLTLNYGTDTGLIRTVDTLAGHPQAPCLLKQELSDYQSTSRTLPRLPERAGGMILGFASDLGFSDDTSIDGDLHHTAPRPRFRLRRTI